MNIQQVFNAISYRIVESTPFLYHCFGANEPRSYSFSNKNNEPCGSFVADASGKVYELSVENGEDDEARCYRWIDPDFQDALFAEIREHNSDPTIAWDEVKYSEIEVEEDILTKTQAISNGLVFDTRIITPVDLSDEEFLTVSKMAHERDITVNKMFEFIISEVIKVQKEEQKNLTIPIQAKKFSSF